MKKIFCTILIALIMTMSFGAVQAFADSDLPDWYPEDLSGFNFYHDEDAARVVDNADIFTDEEEALIEQRIGEIRSELERDIVIFTDNSTYGMDRSVYAADFYDYNGYGYGDEREGMCLMICMDPDDRGWWCCCTGPDTKGLYTEGIANTMDNTLYRYMDNGNYAEGVSEWIEEVRNLYLKGSPFAPEWVPDRGTEFVRTHNSDEPRVTDFTGTMSDEQLAELTSRAEEISDKYGIDVVLNITDSTDGMSMDEYMQNYYQYKGYGLGDDYDGILVMFHTFFDTCNIYAEGSGYENLTDTNYDRITSLCCPNGTDGIYENAYLFLETYDRMRETGRVPHQVGFWILMVILGLIIGSLFGGISLRKARKKMKTVSIADGAAEYVVPGSIRVTKVRDIFTHSHKERIYDPETRSEDRHSESSSSHSSSYSGHSGADHSGSGRNF